MKLISILASASFLLALNAAASPGFAHPEVARAHSASTRHSKLARDLSQASGARLARRCKAKPKSTSTHKTTSTKKPAPKTSTTAAAKSTPAPVSSAKGVIDVTSCGATGATVKITDTTGPNGSIDWLNRGITSGGWNPCHVSVDQVISVDLATALKSSSSPFHACAPYLDFFTQFGNQFNVPPIMLASFAMQESSCQPGAQGEGGEQGLMQLTQDKCTGAPDGNCKDPKFNIMTGAKFFSDLLASNNGNVIVTVGMYNGWNPGMTEAQATAAANSNCCRCQNNLDYLDQYFNGWMQNVQGDSLGKFFNLKNCP
jgi:hypothetical protein